VNGTIYDFRALPLLGLDVPALRRQPLVRRQDTTVRSPGLVGVVTNPRSRGNLHRAGMSEEAARPDVMTAAPDTRAELMAVLAGYARAGIDVLVIDGGDGTVRDVLTCAGSVWSDRWPVIAVLPSGKTNALALDLGVPAGWKLPDALAAMHTGRTVKRAPIQVTRGADDEGVVRGFLFGAGVFVAATELAQHTHRAGLFNSVAVGMALGLGLMRSVFGTADSPWRRGSRMTLNYGPNSVGMHGIVPHGEGRRHIMLASTLQRLPTGVKPFGTPRAGLKTLVVDAPPRRLAASLYGLLTGSEDPELERLGFHRADAERIEVDVESGFILDGEMFPAGSYVLGRAAPLRFLVP
jgi:hypothetical protein